MALVKASSICLRRSAAEAVVKVATSVRESDTGLCLSKREAMMRRVSVVVLPAPAPALTSRVFVRSEIALCWAGVGACAILSLLYSLNFLMGKRTCPSSLSLISPKAKKPSASYKSTFWPSAKSQEGSFFVKMAAPFLASAS